MTGNSVNFKLSSNETNDSDDEYRQQHRHRKHRSRSSLRYADLEKKPKKNKHLRAANSLISIPNTIKLSMLNSGLLSFSKCLVFGSLYTKCLPNVIYRMR